MWNEYLNQQKTLITERLHAFFLTQKQRVPPTMSLGTDVLTRLETSMQHGKMIRGALVLFGFELSGQKITKEAITLAIAMEFVQQGLVAHDDIMDNDNERRGLPSIYTQYTTLVEQQHSRYPKNTGKSLGICAGDIAFFLAYRALAQYAYTPDIYAILDEELTFVTYAQMQDIRTGAANQPIASLEEILSMYRYKTGRYSVTLPLVWGMTLGNVGKETQDHISRFGDAVGVAFQLVDDRLDIFGDEKQIGKPVGSDIREGKQTPYIHFLRQKGTDEDRQRIQRLFETGSVTTDDITWVRSKIHSYGIQDDIDKLIEKNTRIAAESISRLPLPTGQKDLLSSFADYLIKRVQ